VTKVFESEVSASLRRLSPVYIHKCPDHPHAVPDKVDFLGVYRAVGFGVEAKEVQQRRAVAAKLLTPNQRSCLRTIDEAGGFAAVVINFDRRRGVDGHVGFCFGWRYADLPEQDGVFDIEDIHAALIPRVTGGWAIDEWIRKVM
jgi:hypothetical protein